MKTCISVEHLAAYRKTFGWMSTAELRAVVEGRKPHKLSEETVGALRLLLAERKDGGQVVVPPTGRPVIRHDSPPRRDCPEVNPPTVAPATSYPMWVVVVKVIAGWAAVAAVLADMRPWAQVAVSGSGWGRIDAWGGAGAACGLAYAITSGIIGWLCAKCSSVAGPPSAKTKRDTNRGASKRQLPISGKRKLLTGFCVLFLIAIGVLALPATRDELRWLRVADDASIADEQAYLDACPDGRHAGEARARLLRYAWSVAVELDSIDGFQAYLDAVPQGEHVAEAQARLEALKWEAAIAANAIRSFERFLQDYPESEHAAEARSRIEEVRRIQAQAVLERKRQIRASLTDIYVLEGAAGDGTGRDWQNACKTLKAALEDGLTPGATIHMSAGLIQESVAIPDNIHLVCGYGPNAGRMMELNPRAHPVYLMPAAQGNRSMTIGKGGQVSGLWLGQTTLSALNALRIKTSDHVYILCALISGPAKLELSGIGITTESDGDFRMEEYEPRSRQFTSTIWGTGSVRIERAGELFNINSGGTGASIHIERAGEQFTSSSLGTGGALKTERAVVQDSARLSSPVAGNPQASFATPPGNWPPSYGALNGILELQVKNPNAFSVRVGLRSGGKGKDFIVPAFGTQSVSVPSGHYVTYFQYSSDPGGMYQGDSFTLRNNGAQITITKVVNGNYGIRKVN